jgi:hypothetical protein
MKLNILERLTLLNILPEENNYVTLKIIGELKKDLSFTEEEIKRYKFKNFEDGRVTWDMKADDEKDINIGEKASDIIKESLNKLNDQKKLKEQHLTVYERFVEKGV